LADDGNYKYWAFSDPYKATVMKNDGSEVEDDIYEAYNLSLLLSGQKGSIAEGHGVRLNGEKYMHLKVRKREREKRRAALDHLRNNANADNTHSSNTSSLSLTFPFNHSSFLPSSPILGPHE